MADFIVGSNGQITVGKKKKKANFVVDEKGNVRPNERVTVETETTKKGGSTVKQKKQEEKSSWFKSGAFSDGYQFGDITRTIYSSARDLETDILKGGLSIAEKTIDAGAYLYGGVAGIFGNEEQKKKAQQFIEKDIIDEEKIVGYMSPASITSTILGDRTEEHSVFGEKTDSLAQSTGQLLGTAGLQTVGVPWWLTSGTTSFGGEVENAFKSGATYGEAGFSGIVTAGAEVLTEKLSGGISFGGKTLDSGLKKLITKKISDKTVQNLMKWGLDIGLEGSEEVITEVISNVGKKLSYEDEKTWDEILTSEEAMESYLDAFIGGAVLGGGSNAYRVVNTTKQGRSYDTGLTDNEQAVLDKEIENRIAEAEKDGTKLTNKQKAKIETEVNEDFKKGVNFTDTIESTLGGDTYTRLQEQRTRKQEIQTEIDSLLSKKNSEITVAEIRHLETLEQELASMDTNTLENQLQAEMSQKIENDSYLKNAYNQKAQKSRIFEYEVNENDSEYKTVVYKSAVESEANNTIRTHEMADALVKLSEERGVQYKFTNNKQLQEQGLVPKGKTANGLYVVENNGKREILVNLNSKKYLEAVLIHETAHDFKTTDIKTYEELQKITKQFAEAKGDYSRIYSEVVGMYKDVDGVNIDEEITSRLLEDYLGNKEFINDLSTKNPNIIKKFIDSIKNFFKRLKSDSPEARKIEQLRQDLEEAYKKAYRQTKVKGDTNAKTQLSIGGLEGVFNLENEWERMSFAKAYYRANEYKNKGKDNEYIRQKTGWFQDKNGDWKFEFSDKDMTLKPGVTLEVGKEYNLEDILEHKALFELYPELKTYKVKFKSFDSKNIILKLLGKDKNYKKGGNYTHETHTINLNKHFLSVADFKKAVESTLIHEIQHSIQHIEGFEHGRPAWLSRERYFKSVGEIEASNTSKRIDMDTDQRLKEAPESSKADPKHPRYDAYMEKRGIIDKLKDSLYTYFEEAIDDKILKKLGIKFKDNDIGVGEYGDSGRYGLADNNNQEKGLDNSSFFDEESTKKGITLNEGVISHDISNSIGDNVSQNTDNVKYSTDNQGRTLTKEQQEHFKNSKVRDSEGHLLEVYHGTRGDFNIFDINKSGENYNFSHTGEGFYFTDDMEEAQRYAEDSTQEGTENTKSVYLNITNPFDTSQDYTTELSQMAEEYGIDNYYLERGDRLFNWFSTNNVNATEVLKKYGYDGVVDYGHYVAFDSNQIKNVDNTNPTSSPDIRYSLSVEDSGTTKDNQGRTLSQAVIERNKNSKVVDENGNLVTVYHTMTDEGIQFNEFNPVGTPYYRFGDQVVNYYTNSQEMSGSYANQNYVKAHTNKINSIEEAQQWVESLNETEKVLKPKTHLDWKLEKKQNGQWVFYNDGTIKVPFDSDFDMLKKLQSTWEKLSSVKHKYQYEGYLNITNPYVVDAEGKNWDSVSKKIDENIEKEYNKIISNEEIKNNLINLYKESQERFIEYTNSSEYKYDKYLTDKFTSLPNRVQEAMITADLVGEKYTDFIREWDSSLPTDSIQVEGFRTPELDIDDFTRMVMSARENIDNYVKPDSYFQKECENLTGTLHYISKEKLSLLATINFEEKGLGIANLSPIDILGKRYSTNDIVNQVIEMNKNGANYDGVIIKNTYDYGGASDGDRKANDVYVTFNSNQFKSIENENPTDDADWRYSLSNENDIAPVSTKTQTSGQDLIIEETIENAIAPLQEEIAQLKESLQATIQERETNSLVEADSNALNTGNEYTPLTEEDLPGFYAERDNAPIGEAPVETEVEQGNIPDLISMDSKSLKRLTRNMKQELGLNKAQTDELERIIQDFSLNEYATREDLFETIKENFSEQNLRYRNDDIAQVKRDLRTRRIKVPSEVKTDLKDEFYAIKQRTRGKLNLVNNGTPIDSVYQELSELYPAHFPSEINTEVDQLIRLSEVANLDIVSTEKFVLPDDMTQEVTDFIYDSVQDYKLIELSKMAEQQRKLPIDESLIPPIAENTAENTAEMQSFTEDIAPIRQTSEAIRPRPERVNTNNRMIRVSNTQQTTQPSLVESDVLQAPGPKERSWIETSTESEVVNREILPDDLDQTKIFYQPIPNTVTLGKANNRIETLGYDQALAGFKSKIIDKKVELVDIAMGERLIQEAIKRGDTKTAGELIQDVAMLGTELGQKVQALSIIQRMTPEGQLKMLEKTINRGKIKEDKAFEGLELTQEMKDKILNTYKPDGTYDVQELNRVMEEVKNTLASNMKVTTMEKVNAWRYLSMLGNPKTHIRNLVSNVAMKATTNVKDALARTIEGVSLKENRTKTWERSTDVVKAYAKQTTLEMKDVLSDDNRYSEDTGIKQRRDTFKNKILNNIYNFNSDLLSKEDWWFSRGAFEKSFSEFLTANGIRTNEDITNNPEIIEKAKNYATERSQIATFRQYSWLANKIRDIENKNVATQIAVGSVLPFKKTPINIAKTGLAYSPLGFAKTLTYDIAQVQKGKMEASTLIDHVAQNTTGTALTLVGFMLARAGFLNGGGEDDKEGKYDYQLGEQAYSLKIGNKTYSLSWLSPVAIPMFVGANAYEQLVEGKEWNGDVVVETLAQTLDPLSEMSFLSGINTVLSSYDSGMEKFAGMFESMAQNYITQFIPTLSSQVASTLDDTKRSTKVAGDSDFKFVDETKNKLMYKIPGLRNLLEPSTDIWGNEIKQSDSVLERAFDNFIAPYSSKENITSEVDLELKELYGEVGDNGLLPNTPYNYVNYGGEKYNMSAGEYTDFKKKYGQTSYEMLEELFETTTYKNASREDKADMVNRVYDYARDEAKKDYLAEEGVEYTNATKKNVPYYKENPIKGAIENDVTVEEFDFSVKYPEKYDFLNKNNISYSEYDATEESRDAYNWAYKNQETYTLSKAVTNDLVEYRKYSSDLYDLKADKDANGKTINGSRKTKVVNYVNSLDIDYGSRLILYKKEYTSDDTYNRDIINYLMSRDDISYEETVTILTELGMKVDSKGNVRW